MELTIDQALREGVVAQKEGRLEEAECYYRAILEAQPTHIHANHNLGLLAVSCGRHLEAIQLLKTALHACPESEQLWRSCVEAHVASGNSDSVNVATQFTKKFPGAASAWVCLGVALSNAAKFPESIRAFHYASRLSPDDAQVHYDFGVALTKAGQTKLAETSYRRALSIEPSHTGAGYNLGNLLVRLEKLEEAEAAFREVISTRPSHVSARCNLGAVLTKLGRPGEAAETLAEGLAESHVHAKLHSNLGNALTELCEFELAEASYRAAVSLAPHNLQLHNNLLMFSSSARFDWQRHLLDLQSFSDEVHSKITAPFSNWAVNEGATGFRVGFVSGDFRSHPVGYFLESALRALRSSSIELFAYPTVKVEDEVTERLKACFAAWHPLEGLNDMEAAHRINSDGIHVLIDLSGHTANNRLPVFAWRPAPIQLSWLGYYGSTGLPEIDYVLGDPYVTPSEEADHFVEELWQLPESYLCFTPPDCDLKISQLPASSNGFITFGCFNCLSRMTDEVVAARAAILHAIPGSKLFLKDKQLDHEAGRKRTLSRFAAFNIHGSRLILEGRSPRNEYLACYHRVDIALSPFPYGGGTTSVEGLWMGVPVITKKGNNFLSHIGESIAHNAGLSDWIAVDEGEYVAKAVAFSSDLEALSALRAGMRDKIINTPLLNATNFAQNFELALRAMMSRSASPIGQ